MNKKEYQIIKTAPDEVEIKSLKQLSFVDLRNIIKADLDRDDFTVTGDRSRDKVYIYTILLEE